MSLANRTYAFVTPYYDESREVIERCIASVAAQQPRADHIVVADGKPQTWLDGSTVRHLKLDRAHCDFGDTPRGIGALLAACEGYEGIGFLDADNWLEPDHLSCCLRAASLAPDCDFVIARRHFRRPDGTVLNIPDESAVDHVDTSCFFLLPGSFHVIPHFAMVPRKLSFMGDRIFYRALKDAGLTAMIVPHKTVNYTCLWKSAYLLAGETPPKDAKPDNDEVAAAQWLRQKAPRDLEILSRQAGVRFQRDRPRTLTSQTGGLRGPARNELCPCGSGEKFKRCHGRLT